MATSVIGRLSAILELNSSQWNKGLDKAQKRMSRFRKKLDRAGKDLAKDMARLGGIAAVAGTGLAIKQFADFEKQLIAVGKVTDMEGKQLDKFGKKVQALGQVVPVANKELLEIAESAGRLGVEGEEALLAFTETVGKMGTATDLAGDQAATTLARLLKITGEAPMTVGRIGSVLVRLGNDVAATESEIADMATRIAQSTQRFGTSSAEAAAFGAVLAETGFRAELAGTAMGRTFEAINEAVSSGGEALESLQRTMGQTGEEIEKAFRQDAVQSVRDFAEAVGDLPASEQVRALNDLGLSGQRVIQVITTLGSQTENVNRIFGLANDELSNTQALNLEAAKAAESFSAQMRFVGNALNEVGVEVGRVLAPTIVELGNKFRDFITEAKETGQLEQIVQNIATAFETLVSVTKAVAGFIGTMIDRFKTLRAIVRDFLNLTRKSEITTLVDQLKELKDGLADLEKRRLTLFRQGDAEGVKELETRIRSYKDAIEATTKQIRNYSKAGSVANKENERAGVTIGDVTTKVKAMADGSAIAAQRLKEMGDNAEDAGDGMEEVSEKTLAAAEEFNAFADAIQDRFPMMGGRFESLADTMRSIGVETKATAFGMGRALGDALNDMKSKMEQHKRDQERIWQNLIDGVQGAWVGFFENIFQGKGLDSVKDFLSTVKDLFFRLIAEIAARWTAAKIFGGSFDLGGILGFGDGKDSSGGTPTGIVGAIGKKLFGPASTSSGAGGSVAAGGISGASVTGGSAGAGLGGAATMGPLASAAAGAAILFAQSEIISAIRGASSRDKALKDLQRAGPAVAGGLGLSATAGDRFGFGAGANAGFAAEFAKTQIGNRAGMAGEGLAVFKGMDLEGTVRLLDQAQAKFESLKSSAQSTLQLGQKESVKVGKALQDGLIDQTELADLGFIGLGERIENTKSGVIQMGDVSIEQFDKIISAVNDGTFRLEALRGETRLNQREMQFLGQTGLTAAGQVQSGFNAATGAIRSFGSQSAAALREIEGAARSAGGAVAGIGSAGGEGPAGAAARDQGLTQQLRNDAQRNNQKGR